MNVRYLYRLRNAPFFRVSCLAASLLFISGMACGCAALPFTQSTLNAAGGYDNRGYLASPVVNSAIYSSDYIIDEGPGKGGSLRVYATEPDTYNPLLTRNAYVSAMFGLVYEPLADINPDNSIGGRLAERWTPSVDGLIWHVVLREGAKWHDGRPLSAWDVAWTIDNIRSFGPMCQYAEMISNIKSAVAMSDREIRITLFKENSFTPYTLLFPIIPAHIAIDALDGLGGAVNLGSSLVGTGPYRFRNYVKDKSLVLTSHDAWWGAAAAAGANAAASTGTASTGTAGTGTAGTVANAAPPYVKDISFIFYPRTDTALAQYRAQNVDVFFSRAFNYSRYKTSAEMNIKRYSERDFLCIAMNCSKGITAARSVRRALLRMTDRRQIVDEGLDGRGIEAEFPIKPENAFYASGISATPYDTQAARSILEGAGFRLDDGVYYGDVGNGWRKLEISLLVNSGDAERCALADYLAEYYLRHGVTINVLREPAETVAAKVAAADYEMALLSYGTRTYIDMTELYSTPWEEARGGANPAHYQNDAADRIAYELFSVYGEFDRQSILMELIGILQDDAPYIGLCFLASSLVYKEGLRGDIYPSETNPLHYMEKWYITDYR